MRRDPPLLVKGLRPRTKRAPAVVVRELALHYAVVDALSKLCKPGWAWAHYPSGEIRDPRTGAKLKRMGAKAGWPDLQLVSPSGRFHGLELKAADGELSDAQEAFERWAIRHGISYSVVRSLGEALIVLTAWGAILQVNAVNAG